MKWKSLSRVLLFATLWTIQSMEFSRPEYWSRWPFLSPGDLLNPGIEPRSPALQANYLLADPQIFSLPWFSQSSMFQSYLDWSFLSTNSSHLCSVAEKHSLETPLNLFQFVFDIGGVFSFTSSNIGCFYVSTFQLCKTLMWFPKSELHRNVYPEMCHFLHHSFLFPSLCLF